MNYIEKIKVELEKELKMKSEDWDWEGLLDVYVVLVLTVGKKCTKENIHDAWSVWQSRYNINHRSLKPFNELTKEVQDLDEPYHKAIIKIAKLLE